MKHFPSLPEYCNDTSSFAMMKKKKNRKCIMMLKTEIQNNFTMIINQAWFTKYPELWIWQEK